MYEWNENNTFRSFILSIEKKGIYDSNRDSQISIRIFIFIIFTLEKAQRKKNEKNGGEISRELVEIWAL